MNKQLLDLLEKCREEIENLYGRDIDLTNEITDMMDKLEQQLTNGWIPVSERLPKEYGTYMVAWRPINMTETDVKAKTRSQIAHFYEILEYDPEDETGWLETIEQSQGSYEILAWQPLPEPYKEVAE